MFPRRYSCSRLQSLNYHTSHRPRYSQSVKRTIKITSIHLIKKAPSIIGSFSESHQALALRPSMSLLKANTLFESSSPFHYQPPEFLCSKTVTYFATSPIIASAGPPTISSTPHNHPYFRLRRISNTHPPSRTIYTRPASYLIHHTISHATRSRGFYDSSTYQIRKKEGSEVRWYRQCI